MVRAPGTRCTCSGGCSRICTMRATMYGYTSGNGVRLAREQACKTERLLEGMASKRCCYLQTQPTDMRKVWARTQRPVGMLAQKPPKSGTFFEPHLFHALLTFHLFAGVKCPWKPGTRGSGSQTPPVCFKSARFFALIESVNHTKAVGCVDMF